MKKISQFLFFLPFIALFQSCDQPTTVSQTDNRPKDELAFVKLLDNALENTLIQKNDIDKKDVADSNKVKITRFITDTLKTNFKDWQVTVFNMRATELEGGTEIDLLVSKKAQLPENEKYPDLDAITLRTHIADTDTTIRNMYKSLQKGDKVLLTGSFVADKDEQGNIRFSSNATGSLNIEDQFDEVVFDFVTTNVKKQK